MRQLAREGERAGGSAARPRSARRIRRRLGARLAGDGARAGALALALLLAASSAAAAAAPPPAPRVLLLGVDGLSWGVIDALVAEGRLPNLAALMQRGVVAELSTVEPVISPTVWTSIATGRRPDAHGIKSFLADASEIRTPTIFERLAVQGVPVGVYDYLLTWPPRPLPGGFVIPGWLRRDDTTAPPDVMERAGGSGYRYTNRGLTSRREFADSSFRELEEKPAEWRALLAAQPVQAGALTFYAIDALSHRFWADSFPDEFDMGAAPPPEPEFADVIPRAYEALDRAVGEIAATLPPESTLILVSDHGFQARRSFRRVWSMHLAPALEEAGLEPGSERFQVEGQFGYVTLRVAPGPFAQQDALTDRLAALLRSARNADGDPLFRVDVIDVAPRPPGHERSLLTRARQWLVKKAALWLFGADLGGDAHAWVVAAPENGALGAAWPDGRVTIGGREQPVSALLYGDGFTGEHDPTAVFIAAGGPIRPTGMRHRLSVLDVAPLYAWLAGAAVPDDLEGRFPDGWIDPQALAEHPLRPVPAASLARLPAPAPDAGTPGSDAELRDRLRALGYAD